MRRKIKLVLGVLFGALTTISSYWILLAALGVVPYPTFSILATIFLLFGFGGWICGVLAWGPLIIYEAWTNYKEGGTEE